MQTTTVVISILTGLLIGTLHLLFFQEKPTPIMETGYTQQDIDAAYRRGKADGNAILFSEANTNEIVKCLMKGTTND